MVHTVHTLLTIPLDIKLRAMHIGEYHIFINNVSTSGYSGYSIIQSLFVYPLDVMTSNGRWFFKN